MNVHAVIFDMDGLLVDSEPIHLRTNRTFWGKYNRTFSEEHAHRFRGRKISEEIAELSREWKINDSIPKLIEQRESLFMSLAQRSLALSKGAMPLLKYFASHRIPIALGTSSHIPYVNFVMQRFAIRAYFQAIVTGEEVYKGKPHPDVFLFASKKLGVPPAHCLVLEDAVNGVTAAKAAGMRCFAVPGPNTDVSFYRHADEVFNSLIEIRNYFRDRSLVK